MPVPQVNEPASHRETGLDAGWVKGWTFMCKSSQQSKQKQVLIENDSAPWSQNEISHILNCPNLVLQESPNTPTDNQHGVAQSTSWLTLRRTHTSWSDALHIWVTNGQPTHEPMWWSCFRQKMQVPLEQQSGRQTNTSHGSQYIEKFSCTRLLGMNKNCTRTKQHASIILVHLNRLIWFNHIFILICIHRHYVAIKSKQFTNLKYTTTCTSPDVYWRSLTMSG